MKTPTSPTTNTIPWHSGENLTAAHGGKLLVPAEAGTSIIVIPVGLPADFQCTVINKGGIDIRSIGAVELNGTVNQGVSFTTLVQYGAVNIRQYAPDTYSVTVESPSE